MIIIKSTEITLSRCNLYQFLIWFFLFFSSLNQGATERHLEITALQETKIKPCLQLKLSYWFQFHKQKYRNGRAQHFWKCTQVMFPAIKRDLIKFFPLKNNDLGRFFKIACQALLFLWISCAHGDPWALRCICASLPHFLSPCACVC